MSQWQVGRFKIWSSHGQEIATDQATGIRYFHLREPYWKAGRDFGWPRQIPGIGLNHEVLNICRFTLSGKLRVFVGTDGQKCYEIEGKDWAEFSETTRSISTRGLTEICLVPWEKEHFRTVGLLDDPAIEGAWAALARNEASKAFASGKRLNANGGGS